MIKYPLEYSLGSNKVQSFPRVQYAKIVEIIDVVNGVAANVTQLTNITTGVTVNATKGIITTVALTTAGGATSGPFTVTNTKVTVNSIILLTVQYASGKTGNPIVQLEGDPAAGSFKIKIGNGGPAATLLNDVVKIHFLIV